MHKSYSSKGSSSPISSAGSEEGMFFNRYGERPCLVDYDTSRSSSLPSKEGYGDIEGHQSTRPYGSYFSSYGQHENGERSGSGLGRPIQKTGSWTNSQPTAKSASSSYSQGSSGHTHLSDRDAGWSTRQHGLQDYKGQGQVNGLQQLLVFIVSVSQQGFAQNDLSGGSPDARH